MEHFIVVKHCDDPEVTTVDTYKRLFDSAAKAKAFAKRVAAREQEDNDGTIIVFKEEVVLDRAEFNKPNIRWAIESVVDDADEHRHCPHCGRKLVPSQVGEYRWTCRKCDEDFYDFECKD